MDVDWNAELVDQLESHWQHQLQPRLDGLTDEEYFWQPVPQCWTISRRGESSAPTSFGAGEFAWDFGEPQDPEPVTTIAWRLAHLIVGFAEMNGTHFGGPHTDIATFDYAGTAKEALRQLDDAHDNWAEGVRGLGEAGLAEPQGPKSPPEFAAAPVTRLVLYTSVEVFHHGAEICLLRDLYLRNRSQRRDGAFGPAPALLTAEGVHQPRFRPRQVGPAGGGRNRISRPINPSRVVRTARNCRCPRALLRLGWR